MTHYEILEVSETASVDVINAAWKALLKTHHSDVGGSEDRAKELNHAHDVLEDSKARRAYDRELAAQRQFAQATQARGRNPFDGSGNWAYGHSNAYPNPGYGPEAETAQPQTVEDFFNMGMRSAHGRGSSEIARELSGLMTEQLVGLVFQRLPVMLRQPFLDALGRARQQRKAG